MKNTLILTAFCWILVVDVFSQQAPPIALNINFLNRGYCYAASPPLASTSGFGGWGDSDNLYLPLNKVSQYEEDKVHLRVEVKEHALFADKFKGMMLYLVNTFSDTVFFDVQDSRLSMKMQAMDRSGKWRDIEYLPSSWCGNSYHMLYLPEHHYWQFVVPVYHGKTNTQLRFALAWKKTISGEEQWIYSNVFQGTINPGQFTKKPKYTPNGVMDPYHN